MDNYHPYDLVPTADYPGSAMLNFFSGDQGNHAIHTHTGLYTDASNLIMGIGKALLFRPIQTVPDLGKFGVQLLYYATYGVHNAAWKVLKQEGYYLFNSPVEAAIALCIGVNVYSDEAVKTAVDNFLGALYEDITLKPLRERIMNTKSQYEDPGLSNGFNVVQGLTAEYVHYTTAWKDLLVAIAKSKNMPALTTAAAVAILKDIDYKQRAKIA